MRCRIFRPPECGTEPLPGSLVQQRYRACLRRAPTQRERDWLRKASRAALHREVLWAWKRAVGYRSLPRRPSGAEVPVLMLFHDNADYCRRALPWVMRSVRASLAAVGYRARFFFYENDSRDATAKMLRATAAADVHVCTERLADRPPPCHDRSSTRCQDMARHRNAVLGMALDRVVKAPCVVLLDTNVFFGPDALTELVRAVVQTPGVGMAVPCTRDARCPTHYYDTYAFADLGDVSPRASVHRYHCPLSTCQGCGDRRRLTPRLVHPTEARAYNVASAFGGLAVVRPRALLASSWHSDNNLCEHVAFCRGVRNARYRVQLMLGAHAEWTPTMAYAVERPQVLRRLLATCRERATPVQRKLAEQAPRPALKRAERQATGKTRQSRTFGRGRAQGVRAR